jgi:hypothetical protein
MSSSSLLMLAAAGIPAALACYAAALVVAATG